MMKARMLVFLVGRAIEIALAPRRRMGTLLARMLICLVAGTTYAGAAETVTDPAERAMDELASQLFTASFCDGSERRSIGIWAFDPDHIPVSAGVADRIYASALNTLIARKPACVDVLDGSAIKDIAEHLKRTGAFREAGENPLLALERANRSVSILAQGDLFAQDSSVFVSFRVVESGSALVLGQTKPWQLPDSLVRSAATDAALSLDVALRRAANQLIAKAGHVDVLMPLGLYYQDTGTQPPLARYILDGLLTAIETESGSSHLLSGPKLRVVSPELSLKGKTGANTTIDDFDPLASTSAGAGDGVFELSGRYWQVADAIDLKLVLRSQTAETVSWQGRVRLDGLPDLAAAPKSVNSGLGAIGESAFLLQMTSPRGAAPYYRPGEELTVFLRSDREAWLSCFYIDTEGSVTKVLPNQFQAELGADNHLAAGVLRALPDAQRDRFKFQFTATTLGEEMLKCFATTRDPAAYLPEPLKGAGFVPLSADLARRLEALFRSLPNTLVAEAVLTVTVGTNTPPPEHIPGGS
jgi:hypothetical protein